MLYVSEAEFGKAVEQMLVTLTLAKTKSGLAVALQSDMELAARICMSALSAMNPQGTPVVLEGTEFL